MSIDSLKQKAGLTGKITNSEHNNATLTKSAIQYVLISNNFTGTIDNNDAGTVPKKEGLLFLPPANTATVTLDMPQKITPTWDNNIVIEHNKFRIGTMRLSGVVPFVTAKTKEKIEIAGKKDNSKIVQPLALTLLQKTFDKLLESSFNGVSYKLNDLVTNKLYNVEIVNFNLRPGGEHRAVSATWELTMRFMNAGGAITVPETKLQKSGFKAGIIGKANAAIGKVNHAVQGVLAYIDAVNDIIGGYGGVLTTALNDIENVLNHAEKSVMGIFKGISGIITDSKNSIESMVCGARQFYETISNADTWKAMFVAPFTSFDYGQDKGVSNDQLANPIDPVEVGKKTSAVQNAQSNVAIAAAVMMNTAVNALENAEGMKVYTIIAGETSLERILGRIVGTDNVTPALIETVIAINLLRPPYFSPSGLAGTLWEGDTLRVPIPGYTPKITIGNLSQVFRENSIDLAFESVTTDEMDIKVQDTGFGVDLGLTGETQETFLKWVQRLVLTEQGSDWTTPAFGIPMGGIGEKLEYNIGEALVTLRSMIEADDRVMELMDFDITSDRASEIDIRVVARVLTGH